MRFKLLGRYTRFPKDLFRINAGPVVKLRDRTARPNAPTWDVITYNGIVQPVGATSEFFQRPNGASMRPNTKTQHSLVRNFRAPLVLIYHVPKGTFLPDDLLLVHERGEHYSLQPRVEMTLHELDWNITEFLKSKANCMSIEEWHFRFPTSSE